MSVRRVVCVSSSKMAKHLYDIEDSFDYHVTYLDDLDFGRIIWTVMRIWMSGLDCCSFYQYVSTKHL